MPFFRSTRLSPRLWLPGMAVALAGCMASYALWQQQKTSVDAIAGLRLEQETRLFADALQRCMESHTDLLQGVRGLFTVDSQLKRAEFERVASELSLNRHHPGVKNINFTRSVDGAQRAAFEAQTRGDAHMDGSLPSGFAIHPVQERAEYFVVDYLWPLAGNAGMQGFEIHAAPAALDALLRARDSRTLAASSPFALSLSGADSTGIMIRVPVFAAAATGPKVAERFLGAIGVSVRVSDVVQSLRREGYLRGLSLAMYDVGLVGGKSAAPQPIYGADLPVSSAEARTLEIHVGGRRWELQFQPTASLLSAHEARLPWQLGLAGLLITALVTAMVSMLVLRRARALKDVKLAGTALLESEERFRAVFSQAAVGMAQVDLHSDRLLQVNRKFCDFLGYTEAELQRLRFQDISDARDLDMDLAQLRRIRSGELGEYRMEKRYRHKDGHIVWAELMVSRLRLADRVDCHLAVVQDIGERKQMEQALSDSEQHLLGILNHMPVGVNLVRNGVFVFRNDRHTQICGYDKQEAPDMATWWRLVIPDVGQRQQSRDAWDAALQSAGHSADGAIRPVECQITCKAGLQRTIELSGVMLEDSHIMTIVDQSQRRQAEEEVRYLAYNDPLTGLPNRRLLLDRLQQALVVSARHQQCGAVLMLDLDHFKHINETQGHDIGDLLLHAVAQRLRACIPEDDTLARHGGDEFVVVLKDLGADLQAAAGHAEAVGHKILGAMREPFVLGGGEPNHTSHTTLSVGIAIFQGLRESADELLKRCDMAMYEAKAAGRDALRFFDPQMQAQMAARVALEADMRAGLEAGEFDLFYQPKMVRGRISGAEALLRWKHPARGYIPPSDFIPLAEQSGLILRLGQWVLREACDRLALWSSHPVLGQLSVAVNVSPRQFHEAGFVPQVLEALASTGADARRLRLELTEGMLLQDVEDTIAKMVQLRGYGVGFSLDDFGTGYSSLAYLKRLPLHEIKIDQSFVRDVLTDPNDAAIARTIVALGTSLGLQVVAEGVETEAQRAFLERSGCHGWQGYLLSRPLPGLAFEDLVLQHAAGVVNPMMRGTAAVISA